MTWHFAPRLVAPYNPYIASADRPCARPPSFARLPFVPFDLPVQLASLNRLASRAPAALRPALLASRFRLLFEPLAEALLLAPAGLGQGGRRPRPAPRAGPGFPPYPVAPGGSPSAPEASPFEPGASAG